MVLLRQGGCFWSIVVVLGQRGCISVKVLYSGKMVVFRQSCCFRSKLVYSGRVVGLAKSGCIRAK